MRKGRPSFTMVDRVDILVALKDWLKEQEPGVDIRCPGNTAYLHFVSEKTWLGEICAFELPSCTAIIFYDWYSALPYPRPENTGNIHRTADVDPIFGRPNWGCFVGPFMYRSKWYVSDPNSFTGVLETVRALKAGRQPKWQQKFKLTEYNSLTEVKDDV
jgi:hypothetical protein